LSNLLFDDKTSWDMCITYTGS